VSLIHLFLCFKFVLLYGGVWPKYHDSILNTYTHLFVNV